MRFLNLFLQNYGSFYGRHHISLANRGLVSVLGENLDDPGCRSNGAGKSTWAEALDWCLFGDVPKDDVADSVVNDEARKACCVTVDLVDDANRFVRVTRLRDWPKHPSGPQLWVDQRPMTAMDARETQRLICAYLGLDRDVFHAAVFFGQEDKWKFADGTDGERKDVLAKIIPELADVDGLLQKTKAILERHRAAQEIVERDAAVADATLQDLVRRDPGIHAAEWDKQRATDLERLAADGVASERALAGQLEERRTLVIPQVPAQLPQPQAPQGWREAVDAAERLQEEVTARDSEVVALRAQATRLTELHRKLTSATTGPCSACGQPVTAEHLDRERATTTAEKDAVIRAGTTKRADLDAAKQRLQQAQEHRRRLEEVWQQAKVEAAQSSGAARAQADAATRHAASLDRSIAHLQATLQAARARYAARAAEINPHHANVAGWRSECERLGAVSAELRARRDAGRRRGAALEFWETGFGAKGLKSYVLDGRVSELAQSANQWVQLLTGGTVWVSLTTQRAVGSGSRKKLAEDLSLWVHRANPDGTTTTRNYRSFSGGEKYRISLGIDFGLSRLVAQRARNPYDLLMTDELFQRSLDSAGKEAVAALLSVLSKEKSSIFVTDHDALFQSLFDDRMVVRKHRRRSRVVGGNCWYEGVENPSEMLRSHAAFPE